MSANLFCTVGVAIDLHTNTYSSLDFWLLCCLFFIHRSYFFKQLKFAFWNRLDYHFRSKIVGANNFNTVGLHNLLASVLTNIICENFTHQMVINKSPNKKRSAARLYNKLITTTISKGKAPKAENLRISQVGTWKNQRGYLKKAYAFKNLKIGIISEFFKNKSSSF